MGKKTKNKSKSNNKKTNVKLIADKHKQIRLLEHELSKLNAQKEDLESRVEELQGECSEMKDQLLRKAADFDNAKKLMAKERDTVLNTSKERLFIDLIDVLDNFDRAIEHFEKTDNKEQIMSGIKMIDKSFHDFLERHSVSPFTAKDMEFDPNLHEAISVVSDDDLENNVVAEVYAKGYRFGDKILRPAKVVVNKKDNNSNDDETFND
ncbi:MAG: nucleotide exchange factor GrpE [bacterium]